MNKGGKNKHPIKTKLERIFANILFCRSYDLLDDNEKNSVKLAVETLINEFSQSDMWLLHRKDYSGMTEEYGTTKQERYLRISFFPQHGMTEKYVQCNTQQILNCRDEQAMDLERKLLTEHRYYSCLKLLSKEMWGV